MKSSINFAQGIDEPPQEQKVHNVLSQKFMGDDTKNLLNYNYALKYRDQVNFWI